MYQLGLWGLVGIADGEATASRIADGVGGTFSIASNATTQEASLDDVGRGPLQRIALRFSFENLIGSGFRWPPLRSLY